MPRGARSDIEMLMQEARAIELLADQTDPSPHTQQRYWDICADLLNLVTDIEHLHTARPTVTYEDPELLVLKRRLREIASRLATVGE